MLSKKIGRTMECYVDDMIVKSKEVPDHIEGLRDCFETPKKNNMRLNPCKRIFGVKLEKFLGYMVSQWVIKANLEKIKAIIDMEALRALRTVREVQRLTGKMATLSRLIA